jgi:hypothetical protein
MVDLFKIMNVIQPHKTPDSCLEMIGYPDERAADKMPA